ncbi:hypothetical protein EMMF5_002386 [Cystobasidiomycetes sp. EMM_F5]
MAPSPSDPQPDTAHSSAMSSRTPSRSANLKSQIPGILAVSPAMLAQSNVDYGSGATTNSAAKSSSRRNRGVREDSSEPRKSAVATVSVNVNGSRVSTPPLKPHTGSRQSERLDVPESSDAVYLSDEPVSEGPVKIFRATRRSPRKHQTKETEQAESNQQVDADMSDATPVNIAGLQGSSASPSKNRRSRRNDKANATKSTKVPSDDIPQASDMPVDMQEQLLEAASSAPTPTQLSKSAPASSFLASRTQKARKHAKHATDIDRIDHGLQPDNLAIPAPIRSSNSADEWDMPVTASKVNDALTWQQQLGLSRKPSKSAKKLPASKAVNGHDTTVSNAANQRTSPTSDVPASAPLTSNFGGLSATRPTSGLTWQQELLRSSAPATPVPSTVFAALEEGHTGAHPSREPYPSHHARTSSSPSKNNRMGKREQPRRDENTIDEAVNNPQLNRSLAALSLASSGNSAGSQPRSRKGASTNNVNQTNAFGHHSEPPSAVPATAARVEPSAAGTPSAALIVGPHTPDTTQPIAMSASPSKPASALRNQPTSSSPVFYAGPRFHNSPSAGQLPTPKLAGLLSRHKSSPIASPAVDSSTLAA